MRTVPERNAKELWTLAGIPLLVLVIGIVTNRPDPGTVQGRQLVVVREPPTGTRPVYRFWSPRSGSHFYTISATEMQYIRATWPDAWTYEGVAFWAWPAPPEVNQP